MEESLQNTLRPGAAHGRRSQSVGAQGSRSIREQARLAGEREIAGYNDAIAEVRREHQRAIEASRKARSELRSLLMTHLALLEKLRRRSRPAPAIAASPQPPARKPAREDANGTAAAKKHRPTTDTTHIVVTA